MTPNLKNAKPVHVEFDSGYEIHIYGVVAYDEAGWVWVSESDQYSRNAAHRASDVINTTGHVPTHSKFVRVDACDRHHWATLKGVVDVFMQDPTNKELVTSVRHRERPKVLA